VTVAEAKGTLLMVLRGDMLPEDLSAFAGQDARQFDKVVHLVEDHDPHWLAFALRDPQWSRAVRCEIAGFMRGVNANALVLELLG
jgi:hypothetical protein